MAEHLPDLQVSLYSPFNDIDSAKEWINYILTPRKEIFLESVEYLRFDDAIPDKINSVFIKYVIKQFTAHLQYPHFLTLALQLSWNHEYIKETSILKFLVIFGANPKDLRVDTDDFTKKFSQDGGDGKNRRNFIEFFFEAHLAYITEHKLSSEADIEFYRQFRDWSLEYIEKECLLLVNDITVRQEAINEIRGNCVNSSKNKNKSEEKIKGFENECVKLMEDKTKLQDLLQNVRAVLDPKRQITRIIGAKMFNSPRNNHLIVLSLDGGGIRGLVSSLTLRFLSNQLFGDENIANRVHWIVGTSTGAIIALGLIKEGKMTPSKCMELYWNLKDKAFIGGIANEGIQTINLEKALVQVLHPDNTFNTRKANITTKNPDNWIPHVAVTTLNISYKPAKLEVKRNYRSKQDDESAIDENPIEDNLEFWKAARMSSAAPTYFQPYLHFKNGRKKNIYVDGGLSANAPVDILCREIDEYTYKTEDDEPKKKYNIGALLSIGTGAPYPILRGLYTPANNTLKDRAYGYLNNPYWIELLEEQATGCEGKIISCVAARYNINDEKQFARLCPQFPEGMIIGLNERDVLNLTKMLWNTLTYLSKEAQDEIKKFASAYSSMYSRIVIEIAE